MNLDIVIVRHKQYDTLGSTTPTCNRLEEEGQQAAAYTFTGCSSKQHQAEHDHKS
jgi:hypothetical protein